MDTELLSRIQFGFTVGFHILFPTLTIGLSLFLVFVEAMFLRTRDDTYFHLYRLWSKIFALTFGMGVVSGIVLSYQFGTNFSRFSDITGAVMGPLLSVEVLTAFFVEAGFIGVMLFGWNKVGPRLHFLATVLVALGTLNSAFWILAANSWMHTPAGTELVDGRFMVTDWWQVIFNPSFPYRLIHMLLASALTSAFVVAGVSAWYLLRRRHEPIARKGFSIGLIATMLLAPVQIVAGDLHGLNTLEHQPMKVAAMEGLWQTRDGAPLVLFAIPDQSAAANRFAVEIPRLASLILMHDWDGRVPGLDQVAADDRPPVAIVFWAFRIMVGLGFLMLFTAGWGLLARLRGRLYDSARLQRLCVWMIPSGFAATLAGWIVAEVGRQPFTVYGMLRTADSVSPVEAGSVAASLGLFVLVYGLVGAAYLFFVDRVIRKGPDYEQEPPKAMQGARPSVVAPAE